VAGGSGQTVTSTQSNPNCNGSATGSITLSVSGGTTPYTFSWSPSGGNAATATNLPAGTYTCTVTDASGCVTKPSATITEPSAIATSITSSNATCGASNGSATVTASGGTGTLTYSWAPSGGTSATASGLAPGNYTCTVTDSKGCIKTSSATISSAGGPAVTLASQTNEKCNGAALGSASVSVSGGTSPYTYSWSPSGGTNATASNLAAGNYTVSVKDASGCVQTQTVTITEPAALAATASSTGTACGASTGSATVNASGGTGALSYSWSPSGGTGATASGLSAGNYTCTVSDANGCVKQLTVAVNSTNGPTVTLSSQTNITCQGGSTGAATCSASGGTAPYTYSWSPSGGTAPSATGLAAGTYTLSVKDASGCLQTRSVTLTEPQAIIATPSSTPTACGAANGTVAVNASGGTGALTYSWSPSGGNAATANSLSAGTYTCTVTDANACLKSFTVTVNNSGGLSVTLGSQTNVSCNNGSDGFVSTVEMGGAPPITYSWNTVPPQTTAFATGLSAGTYTVTVKDGSGCIQVVTATITQPSVLTSTASSLPACGLTNGSASVTATGGSGPYTYSWSPTGGSSATASNLTSGTYSCTVTDNNGCVQTKTVLVQADSIPVAKVSANVVITAGASTVLHASGGGSYLWSPAASLSCTNCPDPVASPASSSVYCVHVENSHGCADSICVFVQVDQTCGELFVPNFFSPNDDGVNDQLCVYGKCIEQMYFAIYDRWGEKVFESTDQSKCWNGVFKGEKMNTAVFVYYLQATLVNGSSITRKGNISLTR
jgi:gliding motility-associated-like protein